MQAEFAAADGNREFFRLPADHLCITASRAGG